MKILFLDQSGKLGGAELSLTDVSSAYRDSCLVGLFADGPFRQLLDERHIPNRILTQQKIAITKDSDWRQSLVKSFGLVPLAIKVANLARSYDVIYANTQKALVVGSLASFLSQKPLVYHLRDILSEDHFSKTNRTVAVSLANRFASLVIANSQATRTAFIAAGGRDDICQVVYNGFTPEKYQVDALAVEAMRRSLGVGDRFVVGHFSRLSPWKGQHVLVEALSHCPSDVVALFVGDALFGEDEYVESLHAQIQKSNLEDRTIFVGFRDDVPVLMSACNAVAHTSTAPEPFGRVIAEAMLCGRPAVAAAAGGAVEIVKHGQTGWLTSPGNARELADAITAVYCQPEMAKAIAKRGQIIARQRFDTKAINAQIDHLLKAVIDSDRLL